MSLKEEVIRALAQREIWRIKIEGNLAIVHNVCDPATDVHAREFKCHTMDDAAWLTWLLNQPEVRQVYDTKFVELIGRD